MFDSMPKTRAEAFNASAPHFFPGTVCKHGHTSPRYTSNGGCMACANRYATARRLAIEGKREVALRVEVSAFMFTGVNDLENLRCCAQAAVDDLAERTKTALLSFPIPPIG